MQGKPRARKKISMARKLHNIIGYTIYEAWKRHLDIRDSLTTTEQSQKLATIEDQEE